MNLARLEYFVAVAQELHFGRAAERLHMAQPPLSRQIGLLEKELGVTLFERTTRQVALSAAGLALLPEARRLLADAHALERLMLQHGSGSAGELRLGFVDSASYSVMPRLVSSHRERRPEVTFHLRTMSTESQRAALASGAIDIGIARTAERDDDVDIAVLIEERLVVAVDERHRLARQRSTTLRRLHGEQFVSFRRDQAPAHAAELRRLLSDAGVDHEPTIEADEYTTVLGLVAAGEGVAVVPESVLSFRPPNLHYVALRDANASVALLLMTRRNERLDLVRNAISLFRSTPSRPRTRSEHLPPFHQSEE